MNALALRGIGVGEDARPILTDVSLEVPRGSIVAVVGPNGAGKTTLLEVIDGTVGRRSGTIEGSGRIGRVFQGSPLPATLTVSEVAALIAPDPLELLGRFGLAAHENKFVSELSTGMRRILDLALASAASPEVLLLDEPSSGLAHGEIEHLADVVRELRARTNASVVLVEHDAWLVRALADEVLVLEEGRVVARGTPQEILSPHPRPRAEPVRGARDPRARAALERITAGATPMASLPRRTLSTWTILRLGLRQFAAGLASVMILGVLARVLKVDLGIGLLPVGAVLAAVNLAAPFGLPIGHLSDTTPLRGLRRVPYILAGATVTGVAVAAAPRVAGLLAAGVTVPAIGASVALFAAMGAGMYGSGTVFFALLADRATPSERTHVATIVYLELFAGVLAGVVLTGAVLHGGDADVTTLFALAGGLIVLLSIVAVWGQEPAARATAGAQRERVADALRRSVRLPQARRFFTFMLASTFFLFLQQAILQPFGGDVFGMSVVQTSGLSAMFAGGAVAGMVAAARPWAAQAGERGLARAGIRLAAASFAALAWAAAAHSAPAAWFAVLLLGIAAGVYNVGALGLMLSMATRARAALFMGAWTVAHAFAEGGATAASGALYTLGRAATGSEAGGYATVFAVAAAGMASALPLLGRVDPARFSAEATEPT